MTAALVVTVLVSGGVYLILQRELLRVVLGFILLGHGVNVVIISAGGMANREPALLGQQDRAAMADPLPQAFVLTAIVIAFAITVYLLSLLKAGDADDDGRRAEPDGSGDGDGGPDTAGDTGTADGSAGANGGDR
ncbi:cation:proton antiporter subunit C [Pseudonocardia nematodicida]|uniref:Cation:proton antiporter subunit C n=1 Tax=Pseudonocardia nematodicida TaxID=1206997 RepID=A0ABV1KJY3_9PSEU